MPCSRRLLLLLLLLLLHWLVKGGDLGLGCWTHRWRSLHSWKCVQPLRGTMHILRPQRVCLTIVIAIAIAIASVSSVYKGPESGHRQPRPLAICGHPGIVQSQRWSPRHGSGVHDGFAAQQGLHTTAGRQIR